MDDGPHHSQALQKRQSVFSLNKMDSVLAHVRLLVQAGRSLGVSFNVAGRLDWIAKD
jgi:hypothetical protein